MRILCEFKDDIYPCKGVTSERHAARGVVVNNRGCVALLHLCGKTPDGKHIDCYVTPGGGMNYGESPQMTAVRETLEEIGYECEVTDEIGTIIDYYYDIKRKTVSHYFILHTLSCRSIKHTKLERQLFKGIEWMAIDDAINLLETHKSDPRGSTLQRRDLYALKEAKAMLSVAPHLQITFINATQPN